jgi:hypothetical protein
MKSFRQMFPALSSSFMNYWFEDTTVDNSDKRISFNPTREHRSLTQGSDAATKAGNRDSFSLFNYHKIYNSHKKEHGKS